MQEAGGFVQAYCRIVDDHDQPCGSGRLGLRCHEVRSIAEVCKKSRGSFDPKCDETPEEPGSPRLPFALLSQWVHGR
jgi:hypothetical protein